MDNEPEITYRIEGQGLLGWILFDSSKDPDMADLYIRQWRLARPTQTFRLVKVTATITREVMPV